MPNIPFKPQGPKVIQPMDGVDIKGNWGHESEFTSADFAEIINYYSYYAKAVWANWQKSWGLSGTGPHHIPRSPYEYLSEVIAVICCYQHGGYTGVQKVWRDLYSHYNGPLGLHVALKKAHEDYLTIIGMGLGIYEEEHK